MASGNNPKVRLDLEIGGADQVKRELDEVKRAQDDAGRAADAAGASAKSAGASWQASAKNVAELAAKAVATTAAVTALASVLDDETASSAKKAQTALESLGVVLPMFGPWGMAASVALNGIAMALGEVDKGAQKARQSTEELADYLDQNITERTDRWSRLSREARAAAGTVARATEREIAVLGSATAASLAQVRRERAIISAQLVEDAQQVATLQRFSDSTGPLGQTLKALEERQAARVAALKVLDQQIATIEAPLKPPVQAARESIEASIEPLLEALSGAQDVWASAMGRLYLEARNAVVRDYVSRLQEGLGDIDDVFASGIVQIREAGTAAERLRYEMSEAIEVTERLQAGVGAFGQSAAQSFGQAGAAAIFYGDSLGEMVRAELERLAVKAAGEAIAQTATGFGYLAAGLFGWGPGLAAAEAAFTSAGIWAGIAAGGALGTMAMGGFKGGGGGSATGGASAPQSSTERDLSSRMRPPQDEGPRETAVTINLAAGRAGRQLSRQDAQAIIGALADISRGASIGVGRA